MGIAYAYVGVMHFLNPSFFLQIMPPYLPYHLQLVYLSGLAEIVLGIALIIPQTRKIAALGIIALLIAVFPANIYLAFNEEPQKALQISAFAASWIRLPIQFVLGAIAYWHFK